VPISRTRLSLRTLLDATHRTSRDAHATWNPGLIKYRSSLHEPRAAVRDVDEHRDTNDAADGAAADGDGWTPVLIRGSTPDNTSG
jgi:hypothetical protein